MFMEIVDHTLVNTIKRKNKLEAYHQFFHRRITGDINHFEEIEFQISLQVLASIVTVTKGWCRYKKEKPEKLGFSYLMKKMEGINYANQNNNS